MCRRIKAEATLADTFVVLMSGKATLGGRKPSELEPEADDYMPKSIGRDEFLARIQTIARLQATTAELRINEHNYRQLTENIRDAFWITDPAMREVIYVSPAYQEIWGRSCESLYASPRDWLEAIHPEDRERVRNAVEAAESTGQYQEVYRIQRPDASIRWIQDRSFPVRDEFGKISRIVGIAKDITERKRAEKRGAAFSQLSHRLSVADTREQAAEVIFDIGSELFGWDAGFAVLYSTEEDRIIPLLTLDTVAGERMRFPLKCLSPIPSPMMRRVINLGAELIDRTRPLPEGLEFVPFGNVTRHAASLMFVPVRLNGLVIGVISIQSFTPRAYNQEDLEVFQSMADICSGALQRIQAAEALKEAEAKYRLISENSTDAIFASDMDRRPVYANPALTGLTGYTFDEIRERGFLSWVHPADRDKMLKLWDALYVGKVCSEVEFQLITKTGQTKWSSSTCGPILDETGRQIGVQGRVRDISERKQLEREILEASTQERRRIGHELHDGLGQYLAGIAFRAKALEQSLSAAGLPQADEARELATLMSQAISQARILARGMAPVDVEVSGLAAALQNLANESSRFFDTECVISSPDPNLKVEAQIGLELYRIAQEAIHNAVRHGEARRIEIGLQRKNHSLQLQIKDDGKGFDPTGHSSPGMGLRVMRYRAESIGASIKILSQPGGGSEICCALPFRIAGAA